ncbi:YdbC family protein [Brevibacillus sp. SYSU BS000544]|uniref:YdbC family protein n=1 Tax=Brevibacillus sp. SYSU BS000544 TaxID=3416443 RepID=UPI003CE544D9
MSDFSFEIIKTIGTISELPTGWKKQLTLVKWNGRDPKYDIRDWSADQTKMRKGVTLDEAEVKSLQKLLLEIGG